MSENLFTEYQKATTGVKVENLPIVAGKVKDTMMQYEYAVNCEWYNDLTIATTVKAIFDIFGIKMDYDKDNNLFRPVIKDMGLIANIMNVLKAIAPYMENGSLYIKDSYRYYTINFIDGKVTGKKRTVTDGGTVQATDSKPVSKTTNSKPKQSKQSKQSKKQVSKKDDTKFTLTTPTLSPNTSKRDDNTYTVQELVRELLTQMDKGNGNKLVKVDADFLFKSELYA